MNVICFVRINTILVRTRWSNKCKKRSSAVMKLLRNMRFDFDFWIYPNYTKEISSWQISFDASDTFKNVYASYTAMHGVNNKEANRWLSYHFTHI